MTNDLVARLSIAAVMVVLIAPIERAAPQAPAAPLVIGETFTLQSAVLRESRRINVYRPPGYADSVRVPVLYMLDGGLKEDFLHIAGLVEVLVGDGTMRPFMLIGIENTARRRDLTGPTDNADDKTIAPRVGGSAAFRAFIRTELMPEVKARYRTTGETAVIGESLAGLFVVETLVTEPDLFDSYIAVDPSLWWNDEHLVANLDGRSAPRPSSRKIVFLAGSSDALELAQRLALKLELGTIPRVECQYVPMPDETHATVFHPAALRAFRALFKPTASK